MTNRYKSYEDYLRIKYPEKISVSRTTKRAGDVVIVANYKPAEVIGK